MTLTTGRLALPYPVPDDSDDVPRDVKALALKLDGLTGISPAVVTSLPASPVVGQECIYKPTISMKIGQAYSDGYWHLRYMDGKWRCIGGAPFVANIAAPITLSGLTGTFVTCGVRFSIPALGVYQVESLVRLSFPGVAGMASVVHLHGAANDTGGGVLWTECQNVPIVSFQPVAITGRTILTIPNLTTHKTFDSWLSANGYNLSGQILSTHISILPLSLT